MSRRVIISGLGPVSGAGVGIEATWESVCAGRTSIGPVRSFDASAYACPWAVEVDPGFKVQKFVPKTYRKATKVMARDIELAVAGADLAARDAKLRTKATLDGDGDESTSYDPTRMGAQIGAGLIAAELNELTQALDKARDEQGQFDYHKWGRQAINELTPLWLLKYLPNMLACHVTILHDTQGPSNTITCAETSATLSIGESMRVIERGNADVCFCGGLESRINPMSFLRQIMTERYISGDESDPSTAVRPFDRAARGSVAGEGGAIVMLEELEGFRQRSESAGDDADRPVAYAEVLGFGASQTVNRASRNMSPDPEGRGLALAMRRALNDAELRPEAIDLIVPHGIGHPPFDQAEAAAYQAVFGEALGRIRVAGTIPYFGICGAGGGGLDICVAAKALREQRIPAVVNCDEPIGGLNAGSGESKPAELRHVMVVTTGVGGQNAAVVLGRCDELA